MKNWLRSTKAALIIAIAATHLMPDISKAQDPGLKYCTVKATGTGKTTGDVVALTIYNPSDTPARGSIVPFIIPCEAEHQSYITIDFIPTFVVPAGGSIDFKLNGYCLDITKRAATEKDSLIPFKNWIRIDENSAGKISTFKPIINPDKNPEQAAPYLLKAIQDISSAYDKLKTEKKINTPFSGSPEKEREAVIQQTFWIYTSEMRQKPYTKEQFSTRTYEQYQEKANINPISLPPDKKQQLDKGIDDFWNSFQAVGTEAKILNSSSAAPSQLYDITSLRLEFKREEISIWYDGKQVEPKEDEPVQVHFYGNSMVLFLNGVWLAGYEIANDGTETIQDIIASYSDVNYPIPPGVDCDSLERICKKTAAYNVFWGDVYSVLDQRLQSRTVAGVTLEKGVTKSLLIIRGWEINCCTGEYSLNLFFQAMHGGNDGHNGDGSYNITFSKKLKVGKPCPIDCPECREKCEKDKKQAEDMKKAQEAKKEN